MFLSRSNDSTITYSFTESNVYTLSYSLLINGESLCLFNHDKTIEIENQYVY